MSALPDSIQMRWRASPATGSTVPLPAFWSVMAISSLTLVPPALTWHRKGLPVQLHTLVAVLTLPRAQ
ncbi:hypothetical protein [Rugamonas sp. DEMB1]|uniref:hypothetical protein n=1 Tax=Rugamonas sp. DEMB1 TaxID=3039386 RepID=UPI00244B33F8|nr:hypothetical protein [Rugamonas sp. DEMB1]WGG50415.1 hypothetical protein QC826_29080 [Rugamonas sp. DEMB1]